MKLFENSIAAECRYGEIANEIWQGWELLWENSVSDWQGEASFIVKNNETGQYCFYGWVYGSCSGCDGWEADDLTDNEIKKEMKSEAMWFKNKTELKKWMKMLEDVSKDNSYPDNTGKINAIKRELEIK